MEEELKSVIDNLEKSVSRLKGKASANDEKRLERCTQLLKRLTGLVESLKLDVTALEPTNPEKEIMEKRLEEYQQKIETLKTEFNAKRREVQKKFLLKSNPAQAEKIKNLTGEEDVAGLDKQQAMAVGDVLLDKAEKSLARTKKLVVESEQMGISSLQKMEQQNEQMDKIYEDFDEIDGNLARSKRIIGHIAQSAVNDRCIQILTLFVFIAIVVVLVQSFTGSSSKRLRRLTEVEAPRSLLEIILNSL
jgi:vesicle transport through interaction with t-SNAREs protein 1